ncbi:MAG TPA: anaerobic glycerol-3-phosphate dehydrogenase subunit C [Anaerolineae bacterium]|nr:anaerobic glycerol-3-phosphate dehydrogenase subunit C [Caldilineae bacterium]HID33500.1 anaerobic glycerol-3-phosphate dehydrogenase subunit C [Anaerolineae bacterium]HIQ11468.1 anaerobic glycerol-3-phosphate dehydrogenase subunit C [Caldilineales bacterium]
MIDSWLPPETTLDQCIKCNICVSYCPVSEVTDRFPGPKYAGPQAQRFRMADQPSPDLSVDYCSGCRVCNEVCPNDVNIMEMNARARAALAAEKGIPLRNRLLGRNELLGKVGSYAPNLANFALHNPLSRIAADAILGIAKEAPLPRWSVTGTFGDWWEEHYPRRLISDKKVVYFHGCATMYYEPFIGVAAVLVLEHMGYEVIVPPQNCCGLPMLSNGEFKAASKLYDNNLRKLGPLAAAGYDIVGASTSCTLTLKEEAPHLLDRHGEAEQTLTHAVWDIFEWIRERLDELPRDFVAMEMVIPYHPPCQYRAHRAGRPAMDVLEMIPGVEVHESHARCCGIAGTYGYKKEKYDIAMKVGQELFTFILEEEERHHTEFNACDSETCRWQIEHGSGQDSRHPIEILAAAYGLYDLNARKPMASPARHERWTEVNTAGGA